MLVRELMTQPALSLPVHASVDDAIRLLVTRAVSCLPVIDEHRNVVGVVSESDLLRAPLEDDPRAHALPVEMPPARPSLVEQVMTPAPFTTYEQADVAQLATVFAERGWKSIPVVRDHELIGVISRSDVLRALSRPDADIAQEVEARIADSGLSGWRVEVRGAQVTLSGPPSHRDERLATDSAASVVGVIRVTVEDAQVTDVAGREPRRT